MLVILAVTIGYRLLFSESLRCDTDEVRRHIKIDLHEYQLIKLEVEEGIVSFTLNTENGEGSLAVALYASGTKLSTSISGDDVEDDHIARVGRVVAGWNGDENLQRVLSDCGLGILGDAVVDLTSVLQSVADSALSLRVNPVLGAMSPWLVGLGGIVGIIATVILPSRWRSRGILVLAVVASLLPIGRMIYFTIGFDWIPTGDESLIELRTRDVGTVDTPLVGPYSRYGWNHPGPLLFWVYAVPYRLAGADSWALLAASGILNLLATVGTLWIAWRNGGSALVACVSLGTVLIIAALNLDCVNPWNPFVVVLPFGFMIAAAWATIEGDQLGVILAALVGSFLIQSHVGLTLPVAALWLLAAIRAPHTNNRRMGLVAFGLLVACWLPVVYDQYFCAGNIGAVVHHFTQDRQAIGWFNSLGIVARQLSVQAPWLGYLETENDATGVISPVSPIHLLLPFMAFLMAACLAYEQREWKHLRLQVAVGLTVAVGAVATSRISDVALLYLVKWWWVVAMWWWVSTVWSLLVSMPERVRWFPASLLAGIAMAVSVNHLILVRIGRFPDQESMVVITAPTIRAVAGHGPVLVQGFTEKAHHVAHGLALQLEKHGVHVAAATWEENKFGRRRIEKPGERSIVLLVGAGDSLENLRLSALAVAPHNANLRVVSSYGSDPASTIAVFGYPASQGAPDLSPREVRFRFPSPESPPTFRKRPSDRREIGASESISRSKRPV